MIVQTQNLLGKYLSVIYGASNIVSFILSDPRCCNSTAEVIVWKLRACKGKPKGMVHCLWIVLAKCLNIGAVFL